MTATGFEPNSVVVFGYGTAAPIAGPQQMISLNHTTGAALTSDANGNWSGTFNVPFTAGTYAMIGYDAAGNFVDVNLVVVAGSTPPPPPPPPPGVMTLTGSGNVVTLSGAVPGHSIWLQLFIPPNNWDQQGATATVSAAGTATFTVSYTTGYTYRAVDTTSGVISASFTPFGANPTPPPTVNPVISFSGSFLPSSSAGNDVVTVLGAGFLPSSPVNFGYQSTTSGQTGTPGNFAVVLLSSTTDATGAWTATFNAPWTAGSYTMLAKDAAGNTANAVLTIT